MERRAFLPGLAATAVLLACAAAAGADQIVLKDGTTYEGKKVAAAGGKIGFLIDGKVKWIPEGDVARIVAEKPPASRPVPKGEDGRGTRVPAAAEPPAHPLFDGERADVALPSPSVSHVPGGSGRFLVFHCKDARKVVVLDVSRGVIAHEIPDVPEGLLLAAGAQKLILAMPGQKMLQRWSLETFQREKIAPLPGTHAVRVALMGQSSTGPLLLWSDGPADLLDLETLRPVPLAGKALSGDRHFPPCMRVSADGQTFTCIATGLGPVSYGLMRLSGRRVTSLGFGGTSHAQVTPTGLVRWIPPRGWKEDTATLIVRISDASGHEAFHTIQLAIEKPQPRR
jgi:hypothetical protein